MFALSPADLTDPIVACADGPASFNAEATGRGARVVSCDPLYAAPVQAISERIDTAFDAMIEQARRNRDEFVWRHVDSPEALGCLRRAAMDAFLDDFGRPGRPARYVAAALPALPFRDGVFGLALCSHYLFLYSEQLNAAAHVAAIREMARVAGEVRIFPLLALGSVPSPHVGAVVRVLRRDGLACSIERVPYEFQRGGDHMLRVRRAP
jgi:hypothetical protein